MNVQTKIVNNGVNVSALLEARAALTAEPEGAEFRWRAACDWVRGTHARAVVQSFHGLGEAQNHRREFEFDIDHPEIFASEDKGITPVEYILVGLAGCLTAGVASVAQNREIQLNSVACTVEGDMNLHGILGISKSVRNGYNAVTVTFEIDAEASQEDIEALVAQSQKRSAVYDIVANPTNVRVDVK